MIEIKMPCSCLIDQDRFIGNDPIGYACVKPAIKYAIADREYYYFCQHCIDLFFKDPLRVTFRSSLSPEEFRLEVNKHLTDFSG